MFLRNGQLWCWTLAPGHTGRGRDAVSESPGSENLPRPAARLGRRKLPPCTRPSLRLPGPSRGQPRHRTSVLSSRCLRSTLQPPRPRCCPRRPLAVHSRALRRRPSPEASTGSGALSKFLRRALELRKKNVPAAAGSACQMGELGRYGAHLLAVPVLSSGRTRLGESS